eukprot:m.1056950 g.1056950  ORF g.1056950 m.1056950 type:complete len:571 (+) comp24203_c0_seq4:2218-3930(+)
MLNPDSTQIAQKNAISLRLWCVSLAPFHTHEPEHYPLHYYPHVNRCQQDQLHPWSVWKKHARCIQQAVGPSRYSEFVFSATKWAKFGWTKHVPVIEANIVDFLTGANYAKPPATVHHRLEKNVCTTDGRSVVRKANLVVQPDSESDDFYAQNDHLFRAPDPIRDAVRTFKDRAAARQIHALYAALLGRSTAGDKQQVIKLCCQLPLLAPRMTANVQYFIDVGLWDSLPQGWHNMLQTPRYFPGKRILVSHPHVSPLLRSGAAAREQVLAVDKSLPVDAAPSTAFVTFRATICEPARNAGDECVDTGQRGVSVALESTDGTVQTTQISRKRVLSLNHPHELPRIHEDDDDDVWLEDAIRCNYTDTLVRAKLCEIATALEGCIQRLDFGGDAAECIATQLQAVVCVRSCLDMTTFQRGPHDKLTTNGQHTRDSSRYYGDNVGRFAVHGQGHCHTVSSVMFAFLRPFCTALGIDLRYRGGMSFRPSPTKGACCDRVRNSPETHQWLEYTLRPSGRVFVCDLYYEDGLKRPDGSFLTMPIEQYYRDFAYPHGRLPVFSQKSVTLQRTTDTDFAC